MKPLKKIALINLAILFAYSILIHLINIGGGNNKGLGIIIMSAFAVGIHVAICIIVTLLQFAGKNKERGRAWLLSSGIVLLVGFSTCLGNASF